MASAKPVILITAATSQTGSEAARQLLQATSASAYTVRLGARTLSKIDSSLTSKGGEPVLLNDTLESALAAFTGVTAAYIVLPSMAGGVDRTLFRNFLQAAKASRTVKHIVLLSGLSASLKGLPSGYFPAFADQLKSNREHEELLRESGISYTILRPAWFHENATAYLAMSIKPTGQFKSSAGDGVWTSVAVADIAAVAVAALTNPGSHANQVYELQEEAITDGELAEKISKAIGKKVTFVNLTPEEHKAMIMSFYPPGAGKEQVADVLVTLDLLRRNSTFSHVGGAGAEQVADVLVTLDILRRNSTFSHVGPDLERLLGRKGVTLDEFLAQHKQAFL